MNLTITCPSVWSGPPLQLFVRQLCNQFSFFLLLLPPSSFIWWSSTPPLSPRELLPALLSSSPRSLQSPFSHSLQPSLTFPCLSITTMNFICLSVPPGPHVNLFFPYLRLYLCVPIYPSFTSIRLVLISTCLSITITSICLSLLLTSSSSSTFLPLGQSV